MAPMAEMSCNIWHIDYMVFTNLRSSAFRRNQRPIYIHLTLTSPDLIPVSVQACWLSLTFQPLHYHYHLTFLAYTFAMSQDSSVGIAKKLRTGRPTSRSSIPGVPSYFSFLSNFQIGSGFHPASCTMGAGSCFPWGKAPGAWTWPLPSI
jgi:hypothetical protein